MTINEQKGDASRELISHPCAEVQGKQVQGDTLERMDAVAPPPIQ